MNKVENSDKYLVTIVEEVYKKYLNSLKDEDIKAFKELREFYGKYWIIASFNVLTKNYNKE